MSQEAPLSSLLDNISIAAYTCDREGRITYFNSPAAAIWGRKPRLNDPTDRYCGSSKLFSSVGEPMPHECCWMARALQENREYSGCEVIIEQSGGDRVPAVAYASPVFDESGRPNGAVNLLVRTDRKPRSSSLASAHTRRVLIVAPDDEATKLTLLLSAIGHDVKTVTTGLQAIQIAKRFRPHLVFVNIALPQMDGYEVARMIRRAAWGQSIVLIAIVDNAVTSTAAVRAAGFDHEISKRWNVARILPIMASVTLP